MALTSTPAPAREKVVAEHPAAIRRLALAGIIGPIWFALLIALADLLQYPFLVRYGFDPLTQSPISENALGPYGWLQDANFVGFGLLEILFAVGVYQSVKGGRLAKLTSVGFVFLIGVAMLLSGFPTDNFNAGKVGQPVVQTWHGTLHNAAFYLFAFSQVLAYLTMAARFRKDPRWRGYAWYSLVIGVVAFPVFAIPVPDTFPSFYVWLAVFPLAWLELVAIRLWKIAGK
jgi:hypothetical protein